MQFSCVNLRKGERQNKKFFFWGIVSSFIWLIYFHSLLIHKTILHSYDQVIQSTFLTMWVYCPSSKSLHRAITHLSMLYLSVSY